MKNNMEIEDQASAQNKGGLVQAKLSFANERFSLQAKKPKIE